jgi:hypothetical protein
MKHVHIYFAAVALSAAMTASAQQVSQEAPAQYPQGMRVSLTDFAAGQYTATYERVLGSATTVAVSIGGIGYTRELRDAYIASGYDLNTGMWKGVQADFLAEVSGFEVTPEIRRYGYIHDGMPEGFYGSAFFQLRRQTSTVDEDIDPSVDASDWYETSYAHPIDHTLQVGSFGAGFAVGYQWLADNGLTVDANFGPMFRSISRDYEFVDLPEGEEAAIDGVQERMDMNYGESYGMWDLYLSRTGPWFRGTISVGICF